MRWLIEELRRFWNNVVRGAGESKKPMEDGAGSPETERTGNEPGSPAEEAETTQPPSEEPPETGETEAAPQETEPCMESGPADDLTVLRGIGEATKNRLHLAGIRTFAQLAHANPEDVRKALGDRGRRTKVDSWIAEARNRAGAE